MLNFLDRFLDQITMYRLTLYVLIAYIAIAIGFSFVGILLYSPLDIFLSTILLVTVCWVSNKIFAFLLQVPSNVESSYITALILALIVSPMRNVQDGLFLALIALLAIASKYLLAINKKHIFNPAAIAVVISGFVFGHYASWWIGTAVMLPLVVIGGLMVLRKLQKITLVSWFLLGVILVTVLFAIINKISPVSAVVALFLESALVFFATIMLIEPLTFPSKKQWQYVSVGLVALLIDPHVHVGPIPSTPELTLVIGNIFSYIVSPKMKLMLHMKEKISAGKDQIDFVFTSPKRFTYSPGQYMEWTLQHTNTDSRGNRRYFTLASSPTEDTVRLGVKFYQNGSSYKKALAAISTKDVIVAASLSGDFTLPKDTKQKLVFIAGGIGITPFRSMLQYLIDKQEKRDIILLYSNKIESEIMYKDVFVRAKEYGVTTVTTLTDMENIPKTWRDETGRISPEMIAKEAKDYMERKFYLSGPHEMVIRFEETLKHMGIPQSRIKKDFFPGFV